MEPETESAEQTIEVAKTALSAVGDSSHLWEQMTSEWNLLLLCMCWLGIQFVTDRLMPEVFSAQDAKAPWWRHMPHRLKPVYALPICIIAYTAIPGPWMDESLTLLQRTLLGALGGFAVGQGHKILVSVAPMIPIPAARVLVLSMLGSSAKAGAVAAPAPEPTAEAPAPEPAAEAPAPEPAAEAPAPEESKGT